MVFIVSGIYVEDPIVLLEESDAEALNIMCILAPLEVFGNSVTTICTD